MVISRGKSKGVPYSEEILSHSFCVKETKVLTSTSNNGLMLIESVFANGSFTVSPNFN